MGEINGMEVGSEGLEVPSSGNLSRAGTRIVVVLYLQLWWPLCLLFSFPFSRIFKGSVNTGKCDFLFEGNAYFHFRDSLRIPGLQFHRGRGDPWMTSGLGTHLNNWAFAQVGLDMACQLIPGLCLAPRKPSREARWIQTEFGEEVQ